MSTEPYTPVVYCDVSLTEHFLTHSEEGSSILVHAEPIDEGDVFHIRMEPRSCHDVHALITFVAEDASSDVDAMPFPEKDGPCFALAVRTGARTQDSYPCVFRRADGSVARLEALPMPPKSELYSRSRGLLEVGILEGKKVGVVGLGSGGAEIALELCKAGVGRFLLIDFDRLELGNISRHICGVSDVGRRKTNAVRDALLNRNPHVCIEAVEMDVNKEEERFHGVLRDCDLIICATDENTSRFNTNRAALLLGKTAIFARAITRAAGGDVLRVRPQSDGPCVACAYPNQVQEITNERQAKRALPAYVTREGLQAAIQVGLSSDILPICNFTTKLALSELSRGLESGIASLEADFESDMYMWFNRRDDVEGIPSNLVPLRYQTHELSILRWYGVRVSPDLIAACPVCAMLKAGQRAVPGEDLFAPDAGADTSGGVPAAQQSTQE
eukprot:gnl/Trimastix_PCT/1419.p2 GENE.gnl/Trimastix_PCT/1419~~gnl/Trimastix_PCT/1419.p2  ORF type:complete len:444 (+),score=141.72 gnl/Trimastix_PCT/1419:2223-3554(+)